MSQFSTARTGRGNRHNPFRTYSNFIYPKTIEEVFDWAIWFWDRFPNYRTSIQKLVSYFVSGITVTQDTSNSETVDNDIVDTFENILSDTYNIQSGILQFGLELAAMGNVFVSADMVFSRQLLCPNEGCGWQMNLKKLTRGVEYDWDGKNFVGTCPGCGRKVIFKFIDVPAADDHGRRVRFIYRDARDMRIQFNQLSGTYKYYYKLPSHIKEAITRGDSVYLEDSPRVFLEAAARDSLVSFPEERFFHMRTHTLSCLDRRYKGWGVPLFMSSFNDYIRIQHMDKFNEAVAMDYIAPIRMLSPQPGNLVAGTQDPNRMPISGAQWKTFIQESIKKVKENPTTWIVSPIPVQYQMLGGEAKQLAPVELMDWEHTQALANQGIPQEFKQTTFQVVAPTMGLRMFERQQIQFAKDLNSYTRWYSGIVANAHKYENMTCSLDTTSFVEDDMNKQVLLGLMQSNIIARTNVLKRLGVDFEEDTKLRVKEQKQENDIMREMQTEQQNAEMVGSVLPPAGSVGLGSAQMNIDMMQQQAQGGAGAPAGPAAPMAPATPIGGGGMPFNQGASQSASVENLYAEAQQIAQQLYAVDQLTRDRQLGQLKQSNPVLHATVKELIETQKRQVAADAVAQSQQPQ